MTTPSAERSLHHCSLRSEKNQRAVDKLITLLKKVCRPVSRCLSVMLEQGDLFPIATQKNEQIRILLDDEKSRLSLIVGQGFRNTSSKPIMTAEISPKLNGVFESQRGEIYRAHQGVFAQVLTRFDLLQSSSGRPWTSHANPMSLAQLDDDVKDVCELGGATNNSPSDARSLAPRITATCE